MKFKYDDAAYELDLEKITFDDAMTLQSELGLTLGSFINGVNGGQGDARALKALLWLGKNQAGEACRLKDLGSMSPFRLLIVHDEQPAEESAPERQKDATADPTPRGGKTRSRRTTATS